MITEQGPVVASRRVALRLLQPASGARTLARSRCAFRSKPTRYPLQFSHEAATSEGRPRRGLGARGRSRGPPGCWCWVTSILLVQTRSTVRAIPPGPDGGCFPIAHPSTIARLPFGLLRLCARMAERRNDEALFVASAGWANHFAVSPARARPFAAAGWLVMIIIS